MGIQEKKIVLCTAVQKMGQKRNKSFLQFSEPTVTHFPSRIVVSYFKKTVKGLQEYFFI